MHDATRPTAERTIRKTALVTALIVLSVAALAWVSRDPFTVTAPAYVQAQGVEQFTGNGFIVASRSTLALCVAPAGGAFLDPDAAVATVVATLPSLAELPTWDTSGFDAQQTKVVYGWPSDPFLFRNGRDPADPQAVYDSTPNGFRVDKASRFRLFIVVLPNDIHARTIREPASPLGGRVFGQERSRVEGHEGWLEVTYALYVSVDEFQDQQSLAHWLAIALLLEPFDP